MGNKIKITVFTPVYNRGYCVGNVYESLLRQTFKNFEWLVIDDGSIDNTQEVIRNCISENKIRIRYIYQKNGGQHRALNRAIQLAEGQLLMIVDSDDDLREDALQWIDHYEQSLHGKKGFAGVSGLRCNRDGAIIGTAWPDKRISYMDITNIERYKKNILLGDKAEAYYLNVLQRFYPIPEFEGENDVEKGVLWNRIANAGLKIRWFCQAIYNCEYLEDGMSTNIFANYYKNFNGYSLYIREFLKYDIGLLRKIKTAIVYCETARKRKYSVVQIKKYLDIPIYFAFAAYLFSFFSPLRFRFKTT